MTVRPDPLRLEPLADPDADYESLRQAALLHVTAAGAGWTDHNASDPGVTLLEAIVYALADLHFRASSRGLDTWPDAPTSAADARPDPAELLATAAFLAGPAPGAEETTATALAIETGTATRGQALRSVQERADVAGVTMSPEMAEACVRVIRGPRYRRALLDGSHLVAAAREEAVAGLPVDATEEQRTTAWLQLLQGDPAFRGLFPDELAGLVARERVRAGRPRTTALAALLRERVDDDLHAPHSWETAGGATEVWPPTPDQALRCEPVTADDYASRARGAEEVVRAWAVAGALPGIAWHGGRTVVTDRPGTVTVLVERAVATSTAGRVDDETFLRNVVDHVLDEQSSRWAGEGRRRVLGEELGAALVRHHPVALSATMHTPLGVDRDQVLADARRRVATYFSTGRPERRAARYEPPGAVGRGPWPSRPQPEAGWMPGEAIPLTELVQVLAGDPIVLGVSGVSANVKDGPSVLEPVRVRATAGQVTSGLRSVDGVALAAGDRVLLTAQADPAENRVWVAGPGDWTRADDMDCADCLVDALVRVTQGSAAGEAWGQVQDAPLAPGDPLVWERVDRVLLDPVEVVVTVPVALAGQPHLSGEWLFAGQRVLVTRQEDPAENGVHVVSAGAWTRAPGAAVAGAAVRVTGGADAGSTWWLATTGQITVGTSGQRWARTGAVQPGPDATGAQVLLPAGGVPVLAGADCLRVRYELATEDDGA